MVTLVVVAHPDDEVLGCGASIAKWSDAGEDVHTLIMAEGVTSRDSTRDADAKRCELASLIKSAKQAGDILGSTSVKLLGFPDNRMDSMDRLNVVKAIESEIELLQPDTVVTHHHGDVNVDHQVIHEAVAVACRPQPSSPVNRILAFEVPSSTEWQLSGINFAFHPNLFEDVSKTFDRKIEALKSYQSEIREWPHARSLQNIENQARWRGGSVGREFAETFIMMREIK